MAVGPIRNVLRCLREMLDPQRAAGLTDAGLLQRFAGEGDATAFAQLVQRHGPMVLGVCRRVLDEPHDVEDAFQAVFLVLIRKAGSLSQPERVGNWLHGVAYRTARKARTAAGRRRCHEQQVPPMSAACDDDCWRELRPVLDEELDRLPEKYRVPLVLCYLEGKTHEEAALDLGWPTGTVSGRLARARDLLRERLVRRGVGLAAGTLATAMTEHGAAAVPVSLLDSILEVALHGKAVYTGAAGAVSTRAVALAEGVLQAMLMSQVKLGAALLLTVGVIATGIGLLTHNLRASAVLDPGLAEKAKVEEKGKTEPAGVPLEVTLITKAASVGGLEQVKAIEDSRERFKSVAPGLLPKVDIELVFRNTGDKEIKFWVDGVNSGATQLGLELEGPGADSLPLPEPKPGGIAFPPQVITLAPGKTHSLPLDQLVAPGRNATTGTAYFWTTPGEYTLKARYRTGVSPAPKESKEATFTAYGPRNLVDPTVPKGFGVVTLTSNPLKFKVVDAQAKTDPPGVPLELRLRAKKDTYTLDYGGKTKDEFRKQLEEGKANGKRLHLHTELAPTTSDIMLGIIKIAEALPPPPIVDLELVIQNNGNQEIKLYNSTMLVLSLHGPGVIADVAVPRKKKLGALPLQEVTLAAGKSHVLPIQSLQYEWDYKRGFSDRLIQEAFWVESGEYTLTGTYSVPVSPSPGGASRYNDKFGWVHLSTAPLKLNVVEPKAEPQGKTDPPGVPLELRLVAKQDTYTLDLGGKTPEEFRALLKKAGPKGEGPPPPAGRMAPPAPTANLALEFRNTGTEELNLWLGGDPTFYGLDLQGPGAVSILAATRKTEEFRGPQIVTLAAGKTHVVTLTDLTYGNLINFHRAYWTAPGEYTLTASYRTAVAPAPKDAQDAGAGFGRVTLTAAPVKLEVVEKK